jgi:hypothetical protein
LGTFPTLLRGGREARLVRSLMTCDALLMPEHMRPGG